MKRLWVIVGYALSLISPWNALARAEDLTDHFQLSGFAQAAWPMGQNSVTDITKKTGTDFGGMAAYGLNSHLSLGFSYDNIYLYNNFKRVQPIMFNGIYRLFSDRKWTPNALLGIGLVDGATDKSYGNLSGKAGLGLEYFVCSKFSLGPQVTFIMADDQTSSKQYAQVLTAGLMMNLFFIDPKPVEIQPAPPPPPPVVTLALLPAESTLEPGQTVQLNPSLSGTNNSLVTWSLVPALGSISQTGLYTAPATIELPETVTVTATSAADGSKSATCLIKLTPPATAPKEIFIRMDILFDTNKTAIKPQYDGEIQKVANFMQTYPHSQAEIDGYTDNVGDADYNLKLSQQRAESVRAYMIEKFSIAADRLTAKGYGQANPIADNATAAGRAQNRRVVADIKTQEQPPSH